MQKVNMQKLWITIFLFLINFSSAYSQKISGIVLDDVNRAIPFANIGIVGSNFGTISGEDGTFQLDLLDVKSSDTLRISNIGYVTKDYSISEVINLQNIEIVLYYHTYTLSEAIVKPKREKTIEFGKYKIHNSGFAFGMTGNGFEIGQLYKNRRSVLLDRLMFYLYSTDFDSILFRLNIYNSYNGIQGETINQTPIYIKVAQKKGWITKELVDYEILIKQDFLISLELIQGWKDYLICKEEIIVSGHDGSGTVYLRYNKFRNWTLYENDLLDFYLIAIKI